MALISDAIELFIKEMLEESDSLELQRNELAAYFGCAPSQINYVLTTRFSPDKGYLITSRRGGGGSVQIMRLQMDEDSYLGKLLSDRLGEEVTQREAEAIITRLMEMDTISKREGDIMRSAMGNLPMVQRSVAKYVRTEILKNMLLALIRSDENAL
jgi:transcriptional regulator CtsR